MADALRLLAQNAEDLVPLSASLQDALLAASGITYDRSGRRLVALLSRYRWEAGGRSRVHAALRVGSVLAIHRRNWPRDAATPLDLLALRVDGDMIGLHFAGSAEIRLHVECIDIVLEDIGTPWPVQYVPDHG